LKTVVLLLSALLVAGSAADAATVAPHRAFYNLTLLRANEGSALQSATGKLAFEIEGSTCDGFTVSFRMATRYRAKEGNGSVIDTMTTTYEGPGALDFHHQLREVVNGTIKEDVKIRMQRPSPDAEGHGTISGSDDGFTVPAGAFLPMQHQLKLMALGEHGGGRDSSVIFDGSDGGKAFRAISFVGKARAAGSIARDAENQAAAALRALGSWPMAVSYFPLDGQAETPDYQVSFDMYENGVATGLVLDYGDFALSGTLTDLTLLDRPSCQ
jgi:hypothetical protein